MTPESQRIGIAEACGWKNVKQIGGGELWHSVGDPPNSVHHELLPDYLNDLNAMHEAEKVLTGEQAWQYVQLLAVDGDGWCATAAQRAEAFLECLGLWKEEAKVEATVEGLR